MKVILEESALADLERICSWIEQDSPTNANSTARRILDAIENTIAWFPYMGRAGRIKGTREWTVKNSPCIIVYRIDDRRETVDVQAVFHGAQNR